MFSTDQFMQLATSKTGRESVGKSQKAGSAISLLGYMSSAFTSSASQLRRNMNIVVTGANRYLKEWNKGLQQSGGQNQDQRRLFEKAKKEAEKQYKKQLKEQKKMHKAELEQLKAMATEAEKAGNFQEKLIRDSKGNSSGSKGGPAFDTTALGFGGAAGGIAGYFIGAQKEVEAEEELFSSLSEQVMSLMGMTRNESRKFWLETAQDLNRLNSELGKSYFNTKQHHESLTKMQKTGVVNLATLKDLVEVDMIMARIAPEVDMMSYKMFTQVVDLYSDGGETMLGVTAIAKTLSQNFWVDSDTMMKTADTFNRHVRAIARSGKEYIDTMRNIMNVVTALEDNFFDSATAVDKSMNLINTPIQDWGEGTYRWLSRIGITDFKSFQEMLVRDPGKAMGDVLEKTLSVGKNANWIDSKGEITDWNAFLQEWKHMGWADNMFFKDPQELANALKDSDTILQSYKDAQKQDIKSYKELLKQNTWLNALDNTINAVKNKVSSNETLFMLKSVIEENFELNLQTLVMILAAIKLLGINMAGIKGIPSFIGGLPSKVGGVLGKGGSAIGNALFTLGAGKVGTATTVATGGLMAKGGLMGALGGKMALAGGALASNPVGWVIAGIIALGVAIYAIVKNWDKIKKAFAKPLATLKKSFDGLMVSLKAFRDAVKPIWEKVLLPILKGLGAIIGGVLFVAIYAVIGVLTLLVKGITLVVDAYTWAIEQLTKVIDWIKEKIPWAFKETRTDWAKEKIPWAFKETRAETATKALNTTVDASTQRGVSMLVPPTNNSKGTEVWGRGLQATPFANGGVITKPTIGLVGEAGPEAIIPLNRMFKQIIVGHSSNQTNPNYKKSDINRLQKNNDDVDVESILAKMEWMVSVLAGKLTELRTDAEMRERIANLKSPKFIDAS